LADRNANFPDLTKLLEQRLGLKDNEILFPALIYFRAAFFLTLREVLPLREWLSGRDRSEIDLMLIPAMNRTRDRWQPRLLQQA
jgi:hypothetical protein